MSWANKLYRLGVLAGVLGLGVLSNVAMADPPKQCYMDAVSAYRAMSHAQTLAKKHALKLNINTATASDFASLSGVGVNTAERIVRHRTQVGRFASVDELLQVKGIGEVTLNKNRHRLSVAD
ncbi:helix-hairpin-helix domain-containing protein [Moraxella nasibovis]|uniref:ComEA family DNA-binding protein n=1 Tax=Moraxella nasibovis TaxID=2904120 RepID=UPI00240EA0E6|nr:helix-hairpin-helix domain-containing protein [Moraxella nasibovis]WFF38583.1 helix-hairpin-helix domain-containing protein [Moraxella nasibovis]